MKNFEEKKANIIILGIIIIALSVIIIPLVIINNIEQNKQNFPEYENFDIDKNSIKDINSASYKEIRNQLEEDYYFNKEMLISNYDYQTYTGENIKDLLWNFLFSYELENKRYFASLDERSGKFCLSKKNIVTAFKELYNIDVTEQLKLFPGYFDYAYESGKNYCFYYGTVGKDYDNEIKVAIENMTMDKKVITANIYVYEYYENGTETEKSNISLLERYIDTQNYNSANNVVINYLKGKVTHKKVSFKINNNGKFFKYQILSSKNID